jgi:hypothetical protein
MLERENKEFTAKNGPPTPISHRKCDGPAEDLILSLSHRIAAVESSLSSKVDRR